MFGYESFDHLIRTCIYNLKCQKFRMICLSIYCLLSTGCGKEVKTNESGEQDTKRPGLSASVIKIKNTTQKDSEYTFSNLGDVYIPAKLKYISGDSSKQAKVYYAKNDVVEELYCLYENTDNSDNDLEYG